MNRIGSSLLRIGLLCLVALSSCRSADASLTLASLDIPKQIGEADALIELVRWGAEENEQQQWRDMIEQSSRVASLARRLERNYANWLTLDAREQRATYDELESELVGLVESKRELHEAIQQRIADGNP